MDDKAAQEAARLLAQARRPLVWAGGGVVGGGVTAELTRLAEAAQAPVVTCREGRGALAEDHLLCLGAFPPPWSRCAPTSSRPTWCSPWAPASSCTRPTPGGCGCRRT